eukprot:GEMP01006757.1.p1 GENE.GEMP01006757.1~~GEMP01006757.1.p1  ORF type:complete len:759 (+),score=82.79 GEMP01006757.1:920-3196(+)
MSLVLRHSGSYDDGLAALHMTAKVAEIIATASVPFERQLGIRLTVADLVLPIGTLYPWFLNGAPIDVNGTCSVFPRDYFQSARLEALSAWRQTLPRAKQVAAWLFFTACGHPVYRDTVGRSQSAGTICTTSQNGIVLRLDSSYPPHFVVMHELGHLFGALHPFIWDGVPKRAENGIMDYSMFPDGAVGAVDAFQTIHEPNMCQTLSRALNGIFALGVTALILRAWHDMHEQIPLLPFGSCWAVPDTSPSQISELQSHQTRCSDELLVRCFRSFTASDMKNYYFRRVDTVLRQSANKDCRMCRAEIIRKYRVCRPSTFACASGERCIKSSDGHHRCVLACTREHCDPAYCVQSENACLSKCFPSYENDATEVAATTDGPAIESFCFTPLEICVKNVCVPSCMSFSTKSTCTADGQLSCLWGSAGRCLQHCGRQQDHQPCPLHLTCHAGVCIAKCTKLADCMFGAEACVGGKCVLIPSHTVNQRMVRQTCTRQTEPPTGQFINECLIGYRCDRREGGASTTSLRGAVAASSRGVCVPGCYTNEDCYHSNAYMCVDGQCVVRCARHRQENACDVRYCTWDTVDSLCVGYCRTGVDATLTCEIFNPPQKCIPLASIKRPMNSTIPSKHNWNGICLGMCNQFTQSQCAHHPNSCYWKHCECHSLWMDHSQWYNLTQNVLAQGECTNSNGKTEAQHVCTCGTRVCDAGYRCLLEAAKGLEPVGECVPTVCGPNERVKDHQCVPCERNKTRLGIDVPYFEDTECV